MKLLILGALRDGFSILGSWFEGVAIWFGHHYGRVEDDTNGTDA